MVKVVSASARQMAPLSFFRPVMIALLLVAYSTVLELAYRDVVAPRFGYLGYIYREPDRFLMALALIALVVAASTLPRAIARASDIVIWMLFVVVLVPIGQVPFFGSSLRGEEVLAYALFCATVLVAVARLSATRMMRTLIRVGHGSARWFWLLVILSTIATYSYSFAIFGFQLELMGLFEVASTRLEYRDQIAPTAPLLGYLISNQGNVINPLLMCIGIYRNSWLMAGAGALGQLLLFSVTGFKTAVLSIAVCLIVSLVLSHRERIGGVMILAGTVGLGWAAVLVDRVMSVGAVDIIVNRMLITAGHLTPYYIQVFSEHGWAYWAYSFLSGLIPNPYPVSPGFYVSIVVLGRPDIQSNANLFADGYANLGYIGVIIEAAFLLLILLLLNSAARGVPFAIVLPTLIVPSFALANGSPFTAFLSFGFALATVMFALYPRDVAADDGQSSMIADAIGAQGAKSQTP